MSPVCQGAEFRRDRAQRWEEAGLQLHTGDVIRGGLPRDQGRGCRQGTGAERRMQPLAHLERLEQQGCPGTGAPEHRQERRREGSSAGSSKLA